MLELCFDWEVNFKVKSIKDKHNAALRCAVKCGFIDEGVNLSKEELEKYVGSWLKPHLAKDFHHNMSTLEDWIGASSVGNSKPNLVMKYQQVKGCVATMNLDEAEAASVRLVFMEIINWDELI